MRIRDSFWQEAPERLQEARDNVEQIRSGYYECWRVENGRRIDETAAALKSCLLDITGYELLLRMEP